MKVYKDEECGGDCDGEVSQCAGDREVKVIMKVIEKITTRM